MPEQKISEVMNLADKHHALGVMGETVPASSNYHDLMLMMTPAEWAAYRVFVASGGNDRQSAFGGISPEGNLNIYGNGDAAMADLANRLIAETEGRTPPFYRASLPGLGAISRYQPLHRSLTLLKFIHTLEADAAAFPPGSTDYELRRVSATAPDLDAVKLWYEAYNAETNSSYAAPSLESLGSRGLYLLHRGGEFVGACANTVTNRKRLWVGRMFVFPDDRRRGVGTELQRHMANLARQTGQSLALHVHSDNLRAIKFYEALGFKKTGVGFYAKYAP